MHETASRFPFDNSYARLPAHFYARLNPEQVSNPGLIKINHSLARHLGLDGAYLGSTDGIEIIADNWMMAGPCCWAK